MDAHEASHLRRAKDLVDRAYAQPLDVAALARTAHMSVAHFSRRFRQCFGDPPHQYVLTRRVERAQELLRNTDTSVSDDLPRGRLPEPRLVQRRVSPRRGNDADGLPRHDRRLRAERARLLGGVVDATRSSRNREASGRGRRIASQP